MLKHLNRKISTPISIIIIVILLVIFIDGAYIYQQYLIKKSNFKNNNTNSQNEILDKTYQTVLEKITSHDLTYQIELLVEDLCIIDVDSYLYAQPVTGEKVYQIREKHSQKCNGDPVDPMLFLVKVNLSTGEIADYAYSDYYFEKYNPTANWKTYKNNDYGFELKYPDNWAVLQTWRPAIDGIGGVILGDYGDGDYYGINVDIISDKNKLKEFSLTNNYLVERAGVFFLIFPNNVPYDEFNNIISTFKFINILTKIGECSKTTVSEIGTDGGAIYVKYTNGGQQFSEIAVEGINNSIIGDAINLCLISIPTNCPIGDARGKIYEATNLRTGERWQAQNSRHGCGGA